MNDDFERFQRRANWLYRAIMTLGIIGVVLNLLLFGLHLAGF